ASRISSGLVTSAAAAKAVPPAPAMLAVNSSSSSRLRARRPTLHPLPARICATAAPIPLDAPVITAVWFAKLMAHLLFGHVLRNLAERRITSPGVGPAARPPSGGRTGRGFAARSARRGAPPA